ncbi:MAG: DUF342 domain-containing protein [Spirochaetales bacterium]|nr:DUF342 domain-containing protein [Spirochaetales bacterium]
MFFGILDIQIEPLQIYASLSKTDSNSGERWDEGSFKKRLEELGIIQWVPKAKIAEALLFFEEMKKGEDHFILASGKLPGEPEDEKLEWKLMAIPKGLEKQAEEALEKAALPRIPKQAEQVKAKGFDKASSFSRGSHEINQGLIKTGWTKANDVFAAIKSGKPGTPGFDVFGRSIASRKPEKIKVHLGENVVLTPKGLVAEKSGIVRFAGDWVDIIFFSPPDFEVKKSKDKVNCLLDYSPGSAQFKHLTIKAILDHCSALGFDSNDLLPESSIQEIIQEADEKQKAIKDVPLCENKDAKVDIIISEDKMKAILNLEKGKGRGIPLRLQEVSQKIIDSGVKGFQKDVLKNDLLAFYNSEELVLSDYILCEGKVPQKGEDGRLEFTTSFVSPKSLETIIKVSSQQAEELGGIKSLSDFPLNLVKKIAEVDKDNIVAELIRPSSGTPGKDVQGKILQGELGNVASFMIYENIEIKGQNIIATKKGILEVGQKDGKILLRVRKHRDFEAQIVLKDENMEALVTLFPSEGTGKMINSELLKHLLALHKVTKGINYPKLEEIVLRCQEGEMIRRESIAQGLSPTDGSPWKWLIKKQLATGSRVNISATGKADFRSQDRITLVRPGEFLGEIHPPEIEPKDGWDVTGRILKAKASQTLVLDLGEGIEKKEEQDGIIKLYSQLEGELYHEHGKMEVRKVHVVKGDVGNKTGHIQFNGNVRVEGNVLDGFKVIAQGNIYITGTVQAALISAEGDITVEKGIAGAEKAIIRSKGSITAQFVQDATLLAVENIILGKSALRCQIKCNGKVITHHEKGALIGGSIKAKMGCEVNNIGAISGVKTEISFGQDYLFGDQIENEEREIQKLQMGVLKIAKEMHEMETSGHRNMEALTGKRQEKFQLLKLIEKRKHRMIFLKEKFDQHVEGSELHVSGIAYSGVVIESHQRYKHVEQDIRMVAYFFDQKTGKIGEKPLVIGDPKYKKTRKDS